MITQESGHNGDYINLPLEEVVGKIGREPRQSVLVHYTTVAGGERVSRVTQLSVEQAKLLANLRHDVAGRYLSYPEKELASRIPLDLLTVIPHDDGLFASLTSASLSATYDVGRDRI